MAVVMGQSRRFSASSPVTRYWLANCVGFSLTGGGHGIVERVLSDASPFEPSLLEVRTNRHRLRCVPASSVVEVIPAERVLVVAGGSRGIALPKQHEWRDRVQRLLRRGGHVAVAVGFLLLGLATWLVRLAGAAWRVGFPLAVAAGKRGGKDSARLVRSVPWQQYGRSARSATTRLSQARSTRSSPRRTTSSEQSSSKSSGDAARTTSST
jgi:hypothetical protein